MPYLFTAAYQSWFDYMANGGKHYSNGTFISDAVALFAKQWGFDCVPAIIYDNKNEFTDFFYSIKDLYGCDMDILLCRMERDENEKFACECFVRFPVAYQKWYINWLNEGIEHFIMATCDSYIEDLYHIDAELQYHQQQHQENFHDDDEYDHLLSHLEQEDGDDDDLDSLPDLISENSDTDQDDPFKDYHYQPDTKKTNDDITPEQALQLIDSNEKIDTQFTFSSMSYEEAQQLQQDADSAWNDTTQYHQDNHFNKNKDWDYSGGW
tara:strand:- start:2726 stop:3523 length:798 start_codon:yes stop_codon:yes gene_type:complete